MLQSYSHLQHRVRLRNKGGIKHARLSGTTHYLQQLLNNIAIISEASKERKCKVWTVLTKGWKEKKKTKVN